MIEVVCCLDDSFVEYSGLMLDSLFVHNPTENFRVHIILNSTACAKTKGRLSELGKKFSYEFCFYTVSHDLIKSFPRKEKDHISVSAYIRLFMADLLPDNIDKVLYLDGDMIVVDSIKELWETKIDDVMVAAVEERYPFDTDSPDRLCYPREYSYFNSGVMMVNLKKWRETNFSHRCLELIQNHPERIHLHDQDVLNALVYNQKIFISIRWNLMDFFVYKRPHIQDRRIDDWKEAIQHPAIIHFTGKRKPWRHFCDSPYRDFYINFAKSRGWKVQNRASALHYFMRKGLYKLINKKKTMKVPMPGK